MQNIDLSQVNTPTAFVIAVLIIFFSFFAGVLAYFDKITKNQSESNNNLINLSILSTEDLILFYKNSLKTLESKIQDQEKQIQDLKKEVEKLKRINLKFEMELIKRGLQKEIQVIKNENENKTN